VGIPIPTAALVNLHVDCADNIASSILFPMEKRPTYVNLALGHESFTDYRPILASGHCQLSEFFVLDPDINVSDHLPQPLFATIRCIALSTIDKGRTNSSNIKTTQLQLRWDQAVQANVSSFYNFSGEQLGLMKCGLATAVARLLMTYVLLLTTVIRQLSMFW